VQAGAEDEVAVEEGAGLAEEIEEVGLVHDAGALTNERFASWRLRNSLANLP
jgi:hypothetical protein